MCQKKRNYNKHWQSTDPKSHKNVKLRNILIEVSRGIALKDIYDIKIQVRFTAKYEKSASY